MTKTARRTATALPKSTPHPDADIFALAAQFWDLQPQESSIEDRLKPLNVAFDAIGRTAGYEQAVKWSDECGREALIGERDVIWTREGDLIESMIKLQPKTIEGAAAVASAFKADQDHFWREPEPDRDWDISLLTRFLDGLIERGFAARALAQKEDART